MKRKINTQLESGSSRRRFLQQVGVGGLSFIGFTAVSEADPTRSVPAITNLVLDDAVQCNAGGPCEAAASISVDFSLDSGDTFDADLEIVTPGRSRIAPKAENGVMQGNCGLAHQGDATASGVTPVTETISKPAGNDPSLAPGRYQIFLRSNSSVSVGAQVSASLSICGLGTGAGAIVRMGPMDVVDIGSINLSAGGSMRFRLLGSTGSNSTF